MDINQSKHQIQISNCLKYLKGDNSSQVCKQSLIEVLSSHEYFESDDEVLKRSAVQHLAEKAEYHFQAKNSFLFHKEQYSDYAFVLLEGAAIKLVPKEVEELSLEYSLLKDFKQTLRRQFSKEGEISTEVENEIEDIRTRISSLKQRNHTLDKTIKCSCGVAYKTLYFNFQMDDNVCLFKKQITISQGQLFGNVSCVESFDQRRPFSVFVTQDSRFCAIKLSHIQSIMQQKIKHRSFLNQYLNSCSFDFKYLMDLSYFSTWFSIKKYSKGQFVFRQNDEADKYLYLIYSGCFEFQSNLKEDDQENQFNELPMKQFQTENTLKLLQIYQGELFGNESIQKEEKDEKLLRLVSVMCCQNDSVVICIKRGIFSLSRNDRDAYKQLLQKGVERYERLQEMMSKYILGVSPQATRDRSKSGLLPHANISKDTYPSKSLSKSPVLVSSISPQLPISKKFLLSPNNTKISQTYHRSSNRDSSIVISINLIPDQQAQMKDINTKLNTENPSIDNLQENDIASLNEISDGSFSDTPLEPRVISKSQPNFIIKDIKQSNLNLNSQSKLLLSPLFPKIFNSQQRSAKFLGKINPDFLLSSRKTDTSQLSTNTEIVRRSLNNMHDLEQEKMERKGNPSIYTEKQRLSQKLLTKMNDLFSSESIDKQIHQKSDNTIMKFQLTPSPSKNEMSSSKLVIQGQFLSPHPGRKQFLSPNLQPIKYQEEGLVFQALNPNKQNILKKRNSHAQVKMDISVENSSSSIQDYLIKQQIKKNGSLVSPINNFLNIPLTIPSQVPKNII